MTTNARQLDISGTTTATVAVRPHAPPGRGMSIEVALASSLDLQNDDLAKALDRTYLGPASE
jgi:hypothetical protein